jgi:hypothetical protein
MPGCVFHAHGVDFGVDGFLAGSSLRPYQVFRRGERRSHRDGRPWECSGFKIDVSAVRGQLAAQCNDAIKFLTSNKDELARLCAFPGVDNRRLDFGYDRRDVAVQCDYLPAELLLLAGSLNIGIELSLYPAAEDGCDADRSG